MKIYCLLIVSLEFWIEFFLKKELSYIWPKYFKPDGRENPELFSEDWNDSRK